MKKSSELLSIRKCFVFIMMLISCIATQAQQEVVREKLNFDEGWKFHLGHASDPSLDFNFRIANIFSKSSKSEGTAIHPKFGDSTWRSVQLPHDWAVELPFENSDNFDVLMHGYKPVGGLYPATSVGWYRKHFAVNKADSGRRLAIQLDGAFRNTSIWLNGFYLGTNESGYMGATYDITNYVNYDKENVIAVRVDATQYEGWFYEGAGIYRHVWLLKYSNLHVTPETFFVHSTPVKAEAIMLEASVENEGLTTSTGTVSFYLADSKGNTIVKSAEQSVQLDPLGKQLIRQALMLNQPIRWSLENPYRYKAGVIIKSGGKVVDRVVTRFGVRTIVIDKDKGVLLNGKSVKIYGVCCHQDHAGVGSALPDYLHYYRVKLLKEMGVNSYRSSHHPPTPELLDACDSLGMLVLDENRLMNSSPTYMKQWEDLILRDRNHPSVFMWSIGNEEGYIQTQSSGKRIAQTLLAKQHALDPTRTSTYGADLANVYQGINEVIPVRGFNYRVPGVDPYHKDHPNQPILGTEMGSTVTTRGVYKKDTINAYVPDEDITFPWWANTAEQWWSVAAERPWWMGGYMWTGFDYRGEPTPYKWPNISSHFGAMDACGFRKNIFYYYQSWWTNQPVLHLSPHWNWKGREGQPINVWVNSNAAEVELFLNGKSQGKKAMAKNSHLEWNVPYAEGALEAIAYHDGKKLIARNETTSAPAEVVIIPYKTTLIADGMDATVINVRVIDKQGRDVPDANNLIQFTLSGDSKFIGVGNGDPSSHEPDRCETGQWQRKLFNGMCQIILQTGRNAGIVKIEAKSAGLQTAGSEIHTIPPVKKSMASLPMTHPIRKSKDKMLGADISFLPQLESRGIKFSDKGIQKDAIEILKDHGLNYVRLRIFNNPEVEKGYSPGKGFCDLEHTKQMALRAKKAGMKVLLDFHYSDYWADPQQQFKPSAWKGMTFAQLKVAVKEYTRSVLLELKKSGAMPDMVQVGNEINHGMIWPDGHIGKMDSLAQLIQAGIEGTREADPSILIMLHVALGGQNDEARFWLDNMVARGIEFDVIGLSYYPRWHGTLIDLQNNLNDLLKNYKQDISVVEYSHVKREINDMVFNLPEGRGIGTCIWEPLNTWESIFDKEGISNELISIYDEVRDRYLK